MKDWPRIVKPAFWLILSIVSLACMEFYVAKIWSAGQPPHFSDLYAPWWGAHVLFLQARNPYAPAVAHEIQTVIYGEPLASAYSGDPSELAGGFAYPLHAVFLLWPTVHMPFSVVQILFFSLSILVTLGSLVMWLRALHFRGPPIELLTVTLFTLGSFPVLQGIRLQNLSLIAAGFLTLSVVLLTSEHLPLAGIFFAISTFKPQFTIVLLPWLAIWTARDWRRRQSLAWSFLASMFLLMGASEWLLPNWIADFMRIVRAYRQYTFSRSLLDVWFTPYGGPFAAAALLLAALALCWQYLRHPASSPGFFLVISLMLAVTLIIIPTLAPHTQLLLLPGFLCLYRYRVVVSSSTRLARFAFLAVWLSLAWQWVAATGLALAAAVRPTRALLSGWHVPLYTSPLLPLAMVFALSCLIRTRTWTIEDQLDPLPR
jgi:hypothetical protein